MLTLLHQHIYISTVDNVVYGYFNKNYYIESTLSIMFLLLTESNSQTEMAKLFPNEQEVTDNYMRISQEMT